MFRPLTKASLPLQIPSAVEVPLPGMATYGGWRQCFLQSATPEYRLCVTIANNRVAMFDCR